MTDARPKVSKTGKTTLPPVRRKSAPPAARTADPRRTVSHRFDKAFAVLVEGPNGVQNGVGRNISTEGMFIEVREPCAMGSVLRVTFSAPELGGELRADAEVRFLSFLNFSGKEGAKGIRGMGVRFLKFHDDGPAPKTMQ